MGTGCKSALHHLHRDKARNRVDDLQSAIKDCRAADVAVLEEQVHQRLRECWAELNQPSPATSLQTLRLLQLSEEEDDATSKLAELAFGNTPKPELVELQQADVGPAQGGRAANFQEEYYVNQNVVGQKLPYADHYESNLQTGPDNVTCHEGVNHYNYQQYNMHQELPRDLYVDVDPTE
ncbi:transcription factor VOZ1-like [Musa acuminata AAA Group]|uniref:transcription factor VOZ1-like n=1 Tax=Musa acuminata AAA Group TaxID=214697 RepID=UPI0031D31161